MRETAADLARRLADNAEAVCREYLSNGRREGHTWRVGDIENTPGRSLMVRLVDSSSGLAGKWTDFATGEHGDLLDLIARSRRLQDFRDVAEEARRFLSLPETARTPSRPPALAGSPEAARRLFSAAKPIHGTIAEAYLRSRGIADVRGATALRFHPTCFYRAREDAPRETWPALLAAVTDSRGTVTGVLRTWLARDGSGKAPVATPRRAMGHLLGNGVRLGVVKDVVAAGEGLETMLSLRCVLPDMPMIAALSATHLAALIPPPGLSREFINARRRTDAQVLLPKGTRIAFAGGVECNDHQRIWAVLDKVMAKHSAMVLLHGGCPRGAEKIAACWADARKVAQVVFKPDWTRHQKAAPFKRNDQLLEALPIGVVVFPGSGVTDNLADKARAMGIPLFDCRKAGGA